MISPHCVVHTVVCILVRMKILKKPSIVQKKMIPHMKAKVVFIGVRVVRGREPHDHMGLATPMPFASINSTNQRTNP